MYRLAPTARFLSDTSSFSLITSLIGICSSMASLFESSFLLCSVRTLQHRDLGR